MQQITPGLDLSDILTLAIFSGAFGGLVYVCTKISVRNGVVIYDAQGPAAFWPTILLLLTSVITGAASAICLLFLFHFLQLLKTDNTVDNKVFLISASLIAGIAAVR